MSIQKLTITASYFVAFTTLSLSTGALARPAAAGERIKYLARPEQALAGFATTIDGARSSLDIATFIFEPCDASVQILLSKLARSARSGVNVRLLLDGLAQPEEQQKNLAAFFAASGVEMRLYNTSIFEINQRMHAKFLVADRKVHLTGGRNIADPYFALSSELNYADRDLLIEGPSAEVAAQAFDSFWNSRMASAVSPGSHIFVPWEEFCRTRADRRSGFTRRSVKAIEKFLAQNAASVIKSIPTRTCASAQFAIDDPDFANPFLGSNWDQGRNAERYLTPRRLRLKHATRGILTFIDKTKNDLVVENASYIPIHSLERAFARVRGRGRPITVLANQDMDAGPAFFRQIVEYEYEKIASNDRQGSQWIGLVSSVGSLKPAFELSPAAPNSYLHGKIMIRDARDSLVGSFNLDSRSTHINIESIVTVPDCPLLAADLVKGVQEIRGVYDFDRQSGQIPPKPPADPLTMVLGDFLLPQL